jgi:hypothetical protein
VSLHLSRSPLRPRRRDRSLPEGSRDRLRGAPDPGSGEGPEGFAALVDSRRLTPTLRLLRPPPTAEPPVFSLKQRFRPWLNTSLILIYRSALRALPLLHGVVHITSRRAYAGFPRFPALVSPGLDSVMHPHPAVQADHTLKYADDELCCDGPEGPMTALIAISSISRSRRQM